MTTTLDIRHTDFKALVASNPEDPPVPDFWDLQKRLQEAGHKPKYACGVVWVSGGDMGGDNAWKFSFWTDDLKKEEILPILEDYTNPVRKPRE